MATEQDTYQHNLNEFVENLKGSNIERIDLYMDVTPTFNKEVIPFPFSYCYAIGLHAHSTYYHIFTSHTLEGFATFWVETKKPTSIPTQTIQLNSTLLTVDIVNGTSNYPYKLSLDFGNKKVFVLCGEIYNTTDPEVLTYSINDEMILFFEDLSAVQEFEKRVSHH